MHKTCDIVVCMSTGSAPPLSSISSSIPHFHFCSAMCSFANLQCDVKLAIFAFAGHAAFMRYECASCAAAAETIIFKNAVERAISCAVVTQPCGKFLVAARRLASLRDVAFHLKDHLALRIVRRLAPALPRTIVAVELIMEGEAVAAWDILDVVQVLPFDIGRIRIKADILANNPADHALYRHVRAPAGRAFHEIELTCAVWTDRSLIVVFGFVRPRGFLCLRLIGPCGATLRAWRRLLAAFEGKLMFSVYDFVELVVDSPGWQPAETWLERWADQLRARTPTRIIWGIRIVINGIIL
jgi:hypothetical protein